MSADTPTPGAAVTAAPPASDHAAPEACCGFSRGDEDPCMLPAGHPGDGHDEAPAADPPPSMRASTFGAVPGGSGHLEPMPDPYRADPEAEAEADTAVKVAIVGYTSTRSLAPFGADGWEVWGMNNLHTMGDIDPSKFTAWFDLHPVASIREDAQHAAWLASGADGLPVYVWEPQPDWPTSVPFPREKMVASFGGYFTNSVSWMIALGITGIMERSTNGRAPAGAEVGVWGIDMAQGTEYAAQRPSCEFFLGLAAGLGIEVTLPEASDLLKTAELYGGTPSGLQARLTQRDAELRQAIGEAEHAHAEVTARLHQLRGALENNDYIRTVWTQPTISSTSR